MDQRVRESLEGLVSPVILGLLATRGHLFHTKVLYLPQQERPFLLSNQQHLGSPGSLVSPEGLETLAHP